MLDEIINDVDNSKKISTIQNYIISLSESFNFLPSSPNNEMTRLDKSFRKICISLEEAGVKDPHLLSIFDYYATIEHFEEKNRQARANAMQR